jgi:site-specific recombinase XerD
MSQELTLPNPMEPIKQLVLDAVGPLTRVMYGHAINEYFAWWEQEGRPAFTRATIQRYRGHLEARGLAPASRNQRLSALRKLAKEATYAGLLEATAAQGIRDIPGAKTQGVRTGNWLTKHQAEQLINHPDTTTLKGRRDRAILAVMIGCGLRREEGSWAPGARRAAARRPLVHSRHHRQAWQGPIHPDAVLGQGCDR